MFYETGTTHTPSGTSQNHHGHRIITLAATIRKQKEVIPSDVLGSYTGSDEQNKAPEQDADDL